MPFSTADQTDLDVRLQDVTSENWPVLARYVDSYSVGDRSVVASEYYDRLMRQGSAGSLLSSDLNVSSSDQEVLFYIDMARLSPHRSSALKRFYFSHYSVCEFEQNLRTLISNIFRIGSKNLQEAIETLLDEFSGTGLIDVHDYKARALRYLLDNGIDHPEMIFVHYPNQGIEIHLEAERVTYLFADEDDAITEIATRFNSDSLVDHFYLLSPRFITRDHVREVHGKNFEVFPFYNIESFQE